ncbi:hypothetical protein TIFTF001_033958 [Ficus carica]|uniref:Endonuclease/exonuclease/phosphatase n=1 Tax=Ficus carica TaxID=3494 RepID=A0AA88J4H7_FICCA|nr:hypothetical protein TIFTF001_033958 [Ficus carica]
MRFYGNSTRSQCHHSWELIRRLKGLFILPWIVLGNFNKIVHLSEKLGGNDRVHSDMRRFGETINDCELRDLGFFGAAMTWNNGQDPPCNIQERLDRCLANLEWKTMFDNSRVFHKDFFGSDHIAIQVVLHFGNYNMDRGDNSVRRFTFEPIWLSKPEYKEVVLNSWWQTVVCGDDSLLAENLDACARLSKAVARRFLATFQGKLLVCRRSMTGDSILTQIGLEAVIVTPKFSTRRPLLGERRIRSKGLRMVSGNG